MDADRRLALSYAPRAARDRLAALWALDSALGDVLRTGRTPMVSEIRLAWWREALQRLDHQPAPAEPVLEGLERHVIGADISGNALARMETGWSLLLEPELGQETLARYAALRGGALFDLSARLLGGDGGFDVRAPGEAWALADLARHSGRKAERQAALGMARERLLPIARWPRRLRSLGMLTMLAARDSSAEAMERQGSPGRMLRMLGHWLTGRI